MMPTKQPNEGRISWLQLIFAAGAILAVIAAVSFLPVRQMESPAFANPAFQRTWVNAASASTQVLDLWGSEPLDWRVESYAGAPKDRRIVQYFERGRMEAEAGSNQITSGALVNEMARGEIDLGAGLVLERQPPETPIDSGEDHELVPTYLTLSRLLERAEDRTGQRVTSWIDRDAHIQRSSTPEVVRLAQYVDATGHNLPDVTVELFERPEFQTERWVESLGYPISEPYWTEYRRPEQAGPSLVQAFERRILIYTPGLEPSRQFTVASSGRHYVDWRYGHQLHHYELDAPAREVDIDLTLGDDLEAWVYAEDIGMPIDLALSITGHLLILTQDGSVFKAESLDPDGHPDRLVEWARGIEDPQGIVTKKDAVLVTTGTDVRWFREENGRGVLEHTDTTHLGDEPTGPSTELRGKPAINSAGVLFTREWSAEDGETLREIAGSDPLVRLDEIVSKPGPVVFSRGDLLVAGASDQGRADVVLIPSVNRDDASHDALTIARFPEGTAVQALAVADEEIWEITEYGDVFVAVTEEAGARLFGLDRDPTDSEMEMRELAAGQFAPAAIQVGLDGSLYVADAEQNRIIRIRCAS
jgi:hypothetical protein